MSSSPTTQSGSRPKRSRRPNLTMGEEIALCRSYVKITLDAKTGTDQPKSTFWKRVAECYHTIEGVSSVPVLPQTLQKKFSTISSVVSTYVACLTTVQHASGTAPVDWIQSARTKFQQDNGNKAFPYDHAFEVLSVLPKYNPELTRRQSEITSVGEGSSERPRGRKGEKERQRQNTSKRRVEEAEATIHATEDFMKWHKEAHKVKEQRKLRFEKKWDELAATRKYEAESHILFMDTTHMTPTQLAMYSRECEQIMARRNAESDGPPTSYHTPPNADTGPAYSGQGISSAYGNEDDYEDEDE